MRSGIPLILRSAAQRRLGKICATWRSCARVISNSIVPASDVTTVPPALRFVSTNAMDDKALAAAVKASRQAERL